MAMLEYEETLSEKITEIFNEFTLEILKLLKILVSF